ncbi:MAG: MFS transporter [Bacteroidetes bacterium]|nr:MFS transporter [Bacteroidota bacterium]MBS1541701.1 MFS transporter [Bacteroidota bacterium]
MTLNQRLAEIRNGFTSTFWIANTLELFERLAFYGSKAVLAYYLANKVGLHDEAATITGWFSTLVYALPIVAGVFVDRYGFKKTLMTCFAIFAIGYFSIGLAGLEWGSSITQLIGVRNYVIIAIVLTAVGGSLIKPCIVGTVAKTSTQEAKPLGFSIYYTLVNLGGALGPIVALNIRKEWGIEYVLIMSAVTSACLFIGTFLFYQEIDNSDDEKRTFGKIFGDMVLVFKNFKFLSFLIIFSIFWLMFWQIFYLLPFYATEVLHYENFEILESLDAMAVIIMTVPMGALLKNYKPIYPMVFGFVLASMAWFVVGLMGTATFVVVGAILFGVADATQTPRFYDYVSSLAPKHQVGTFMGFAFLPVAIGSLLAGYLADWLRIHFMNTNPSLCWYVLAALGVGGTLLILVHHFVYSRSVQK